MNYVPNRGSNLRGPPYVSRIVPTPDGGVWLVRKIPETGVLGAAIHRLHKNSGAHLGGSDVTFSFVRVDSKMKRVQVCTPLDL